MQKKRPEMNIRLAQIRLFHEFLVFIDKKYVKIPIKYASIERL